MANFPPRKSFRNGFWNSNERPGANAPGLSWYNTDKMDTPLIGQYRIVTYWSADDDVYIAEMPELPGCMSDGATETEARSNIRVIAQEWINRARYLGREIPMPKSILAECQA